MLQNVDHELMFEWAPGIPIDNTIPNNDDDDGNNNNDNGNNNDADVDENDDANNDAAGEEEQAHNNELVLVTDDEDGGVEQPNDTDGEDQDDNEDQNEDDNEDQDEHDNENDTLYDNNEGENSDDDDRTVLYDENENEIDQAVAAPIDGNNDEVLGFREGVDGVRRSSRRVQRSTNVYGGKGGSQNMQSKYKGASKKLLMDAGIEKKYNGALQMFMAERHSIEKDKNKSWMNIALKHIGAIFTQMHASKGIKEYGMEAVAAIIKELTQLDVGAVPGKNQRVCVPIDPSTLTDEEMKQALDAVNLIKVKRDGKIKARTCGNGSKQRKYLKEGESVASPTLSVEGMILTLLIAAFEGRKVITLDVPGAFLQAEMPKGKMILMKFTGKFVDYMCEVNKEHIPNVRTNRKGVKVLYVRVIRALYGCIESALQWYELFKETLEKEGYKLNPYDMCIANKLENGKQITIAWYVDDCICTHEDQKVLDNVADMLQRHFGKMDVKKGKEHNFLGINFTIRDDKKIEIEMKRAIQETIDMFETSGDKLSDGNVVSPARAHLFTVNPNGEQLGAERSDIFHSVVAKLLFITKRARPDIETAQSFLCRRVSKSDNDDWKKLKRVLGFLKSTVHDVRVIGAGSLSEIYTWIDASYAVHDNLRSHTGGAISMGYEAHGILHGKSSMQKMNVKSSTEAELVGVSEYIPYNIWLMMFLEEQGYGIKDNVIYQDNKSAILMEKNGRNSCTGNSRHINIRYFFVKDRIDKKEVKVEYCPTHLMLADYFSKPLTGKLFHTQREFLMGWHPMSELIHMITDTKIKEGVGI